MASNGRGSNIKNIRTYIMGLIYRNGFSSVRVPSSMELARQFHVTRRTARMALEGLIAEKYLIGKNGIGTFTNPEVGFRLGSSRRKPLAGLCVADGSYFYYDLDCGRIFAELMSVMLERSFNVYPLVHTQASPEAPIAELDCAGVDSAAFIFPQENSPAVRHLLAAGKPCVTLRNAVPGADFVRYDFTDAVVQLLRRCAAEKRRRLAFFLSADSRREMQHSFENACRLTKTEGEFELETIHVTDPGVYEPLIEELFSRGDDVPDAAIIGWRAPAFAMAARSRLKIAPERCLLAVTDHIFELPAGFSGCGLYLSEREAAEAAVELMIRRREHPELPPQEIAIQAKFIEIKPGKDDMLLSQ